jgi:putative spermidine/putrescine transport system permease protein
MWNGIRENTDPTVAAAAVVLMAVTLAAFAIWVLAQRKGRSTHEETASER